MLKYLIFYCSLNAMAGSTQLAEEFIKKLEIDGIVPDIVEAPSEKLTIIYPSGKEVQFGEELTPFEVKDEPKIHWEASPNKYYTLIMVDPDAPSRKHPTFADVKHWLVGNIPGEDVGKGDFIAEYAGSGPPKGTGLHRYIFLVFEQKQELLFDEPRSAKNSRAHRLKWSLKDFVKRYDLGRAFAANYFKAQWDPYVDERNKNTSN